MGPGDGAEDVDLPRPRRSDVISDRRRTTVCSRPDLSDPAFFREGAKSPHAARSSFSQRRAGSGNDGTGPRIASPSGRPLFPFLFSARTPRLRRETKEEIDENGPRARRPFAALDDE